jgi:hypothetical protein
MAKIPRKKNYIGELAKSMKAKKQPLIDVSSSVYTGSSGIHPLPLTTQPGYSFDINMPMNSSVGMVDEDLIMPLVNACKEYIERYSVLSKKFGLPLPVTPVDMAHHLASTVSQELSIKLAGELVGLAQRLVEDSSVAELKDMADDLMDEDKDKKLDVEDSHDADFS